MRNHQIRLDTRNNRVIPSQRLAIPQV